VTTFIVLAACLLAVAIALLAWPLLRAPTGQAGGRAAITAAVVAGGLPAAAFAIYFAASNWDWQPPATTPASTPAMPNIEQAVTELKAKLAREPDNLQGWKLLGRSATVIGDYPLALTAFKEAYERTEGKDAEAVVGYAESLVLTDEREIDGEAARLFEKALELTPGNPRALWYGGIVAYRRGELALAQRRWVELQDHDIPADLRQVLAERLAELEQAVGAPDRASSPAASAGAVEISIEVAPALAGKVPAGATLFVIARRGSGGPPLAVQRRPAGAWPVTITLSNADAMLPGTKLDEGGPVRLIARISRSGQPIAASGDLFGEVGYDFASARPASIAIDRIVP
jgi:cytochrome c-type biogenesis protein CcmH